MTDPNKKPKPTKVDLASLRANQRKRGRTSQVDPNMLEAIATLASGEGWLYEEATLYSDTYKREQANAVGAIQREKKCDQQEAEAVFENRWISRFRQRATSAWETAGLPSEAFAFVVMNDGRIFVGHK